jgi:hypothetical protein
MPRAVAWNSSVVLEEFSKEFLKRGARVLDRRPCEFR